MPLDPISSTAHDFAYQVEDFYSSLIRSIEAELEIGLKTGLEAEPTLGGNLLYVGELSSPGRALIVAGNIAGAASLAATADPAAQKQAIRDGIADFLVTSLDEALRILKNEIRKRETVAVCIAAAPQAIEAEMLERGVLPDLLPPPHWVATEFAPGARRLTMNHQEDARVLVAWSVAASAPRWLPHLDALALDCFSHHLDANAPATARWLRLAPRYLGRLAQGFRIVRAERSDLQEFVARVRIAVEGGAVGAAVRISANRDEDVFVFQPARHQQPAS